MDIASFIATVTDVRLRREILAGLDEGTIATLPPNLLAEARQIGDAIRRERQQYEQERANRHQNQGLRYLHEQMRRIENRMGGEGELPPRGNPWDHHHHYPPRQNQLQDKSLESVIVKRQKDLSLDQENDDLEQVISLQLGNDEKILESFLMILLANKNVNCELLPALGSLMKVSAGSQLCIRNKAINLVASLLQALFTSDEPTFAQLLPNVKMIQKDMILILIGALRILIKNNSKLAGYILRSFLSKEEYFKQQGSTITKKHVA
mmetsp:Transcript_9556/g.9166  ORF Transcript_9556/g.9166 Transcript_9556/m.9166 type:complete len:265 (-) Transcript_9556:2329-3123(-)